MTFKTTIVLFAALITLIASYFLATRWNNTPCDTNTFVVGTVGDYAPFVSINAQGQYEGFDIDVANALAQSLDKKLVIKDLGSMAPLFIALEQGRIDAIIWGLSITQDRLNKVAMIRYQGETVRAYPLMFWKELPVGIRSINDMQGMTICVEPTSSQDAVLNLYPFITKKSTERVDDALLNIQYGKADAALVEPAIATKFKSKYPQIQLLDLPLSPEFQVQGTGIAIKKNNTCLINQVQTAVNALIASGAIKAFETKWRI